MSYRRMNEVQAVLDVLFLSKNLHWMFEDNMWSKAKSYPGYTFLQRIRGQRPERMWPGWSKQNFDEKFHDLVVFALEQAAEARKGKKPEDIYPLSAVVVEIQRGQYGVELYLGKAGIHFKDGFKSHGEAQRWISRDSKEFLIEKGIPAGTELIRIGENYY